MCIYVYSYRYLYTHTFIYAHTAFIYIRKKYRRERQTEDTYKYVLAYYLVALEELDWLYIYIYSCVYMYVCVHTYIYIYVYAHVAFESKGKNITERQTDRYIYICTGLSLFGSGGAGLAHERVRVC